MELVLESAGLGLSCELDDAAVNVGIGAIEIEEALPDGFTKQFSLHSVSSRHTERLPKDSASISISV
jgi:hypothetical protein